MDFDQAIEAIRAWDGQQVEIEIRISEQPLAIITGVLAEEEMQVADPELGVSAVARFSLSDGLQGRLIYAPLGRIVFSEAEFEGAAEEAGELAVLLGSAVASFRPLDC